MLYQTSVASILFYSKKQVKIPIPKNFFCKRLIVSVLIDVIPNGLLWKLHTSPQLKMFKLRFASVTFIIKRLQIGTLRIYIYFIKILVDIISTQNNHWNGFSIFSWDYWFSVDTRQFNAKKNGIWPKPNCHWPTMSWYLKMNHWFIYNNRSTKW